MQVRTIQAVNNDCIKIKLGLNKVVYNLNKMIMLRHIGLKLILQFHIHVK